MQRCRRGRTARRWGWRPRHDFARVGGSLAARDGAALHSWAARDEAVDEDAHDAPVHCDVVGVAADACLVEGQQHIEAVSLHLLFHKASDGRVGPHVLHAILQLGMIYDPYK